MKELRIRKPSKKAEVEDNQRNSGLHFNRMPDISPAMRTTAGGCRDFFSTVAAWFHNFPPLFWKLYADKRLKSIAGQ
jgi:hypothetical protein